MFGFHHVKRFLVTGSAGHLGEALARTLHHQGHQVVGLDVLDSPFTTVTGSITDPDVVRQALDEVTHVLHTATLHKPHVQSHTQQDFVAVNVTGTLTVLEAAAAAEVRSVVFTSSTSAFGGALSPAPGRPALWITEDVTPTARNIYGVTKVAAENLCELAMQRFGLPIVVLRTARFFPEQDDRDNVRTAYADTNLKVNEFLHRRVELADVVDAHMLAADRAPALGFGRYIISATSPFSTHDLPALASDAKEVVARLYPELMQQYRDWGWQMFPSLDRVYVNDRARNDLGWEPHYDFPAAVDLVANHGDFRSALARSIGSKGYHCVPTSVYTT